MPYLWYALNFLSGALKIMFVLFGAIFLVGITAGLIPERKRNNGSQKR
jgi:hypothetical protein